LQKQTACLSSEASELHQCMAAGAGDGVVHQQRLELPMGKGGTCVAKSPWKEYGYEVMKVQICQTKCRVHQHESWSK